MPGTFFSGEQLRNCSNPRELFKSAHLISCQSESSLRFVDIAYGRFEDRRGGSTSCVNLGKSLAMLMLSGLDTQPQLRVFK
jgi:hypothetical protein